MTATEDQLTRRALKLSRRVQPILRGQDPTVVSAALSDIVAIHFAAMEPSIRAQMLPQWIATMSDLIDPSVAELRARGIYPSEWKT